MKAILSASLFWLLTLCAYGIPVKYQFDVIEGVIEKAIWRDEIRLRYMAARAMGEENIERQVTVGVHADMIIGKVSGVKVESCSIISSKTWDLFPIDNFCRFSVLRIKKEFDEGRKLFLRLPIKDGSKIKVGSKVRVLGLKIEGEAGLYEITANKCIIDGDEVELIKK